MDATEAAQLAAVVGTVGSALLLLAGGRVPVLSGLALLAGAELGLVLATSDRSVRISPALVALGVAGCVVLGAGAALLVRYPQAVTPVLLAAAPFRPPLQFGSENRFYVAAADSGQLGRLMPLYAVLSAAALALAWQALRGRELRPLPLAISVPAAAFLALAGLSLTWSNDLDSGAEVLAFFLFPFATLVAIIARAPFPRWLPRALAAIAVALATLFAVVGLWQAATHQLLFFSPGVEVGNVYASFFRVTSLFRDPSLYSRHLVLGIAVLLVAVFLRRLHLLLALPMIALLWLGLYFSYSQSSMVALFAVTLALAAFAGDRWMRQAAAVTTVLVLLGGVGLVAAAAEGESARRVTSDRSRRVELTAKVIQDHPLVGVGLGGQPLASQARAERGGSPRRFVSHTTPLTVAAELGALGFLAYSGLLLGAIVMIRRVRRHDAALGLGLAAVLLALFVHSLFYSGFFEDPVTWVVLGVGASFVLAREAATERAAILGPSSAPARSP
jgi:hypothetical protein